MGSKLDGMGNSLSVCSNKFAHNCFVVVSATPRPQRAPQTAHVPTASSVPYEYKCCVFQRTGNKRCERYPEIEMLSRLASL